MRLDPFFDEAWAEGVIAAAKRAGAQQAEVYAQSGLGLGMELEANELRGGSSVVSHTATLRIVKEGRVGIASTSKRDGVDDLVRLATRSSVVGRSTTLQLPEDEPVRAGAKMDPSFQKLEIDDLVDPILALRDQLTASGDAIAAAGIGAGMQHDLLVNHHGLVRHSSDAAGFVQASLTLPDGDTSINVYDGRTSVHGLPNADAIGAKLGDRAQSLRQPTTPESGVQDVVFLPGAFGALLGTVIGGLDGDSAMRGRSFFADKVGEELLHPGLRITDAPQGYELGDNPWDGDGFATRNRRLIDHGVVGDYLFNAEDGAVHGRASTRNGVRGDPSSGPRTGPHYLAVEHETTQSYEELIGEIQQGIVVESLLGAHTANDVTGDLSVTAPNAWIIRDGEIQGASSMVALGGNLVDWFSRLDGMATDGYERNSGIWGSTRIREVHVSAE